jgi:hypothetical protein
VTADAPRPSPLRRWLAPPFTAFVFLLHPVVTLCRPLVVFGDPGTGWHLVTGRYILETGSIPARDLFSWTAAGHPWISYCWLFEVAGALLVRLGGLPLFATVCTLIYAFVPVLVFRRALRLGAAMAPALGCTVLAFAVLSSHSLARPHVVTYLFFALFLERLDDFQEGRVPATALVWLPLLTLVWVNVHGGFLGGIALIGMYAGVAGLRALARRDAEEGRRALVYAAVLGATVLATFANPQGWRLHASIRGYLGMQSLGYFTEFMSPNFLAGSVPVLAFEALALLMLLVLARAGRRFSWVHTALLVFFLHESLHSVRHMNLFAIVAAPILARAVTPAFERLRPALAARWREIAGEQAALRSPLVYFPALCALFVALSLAGALRFPRTLDDIQLSRGAAEFIARHEGRFTRLFNTDYLGGPLIYRFWPRLRVFVDDRIFIYGDDFVMHRFFAVFYVQKTWRKVLDKYRVTAAVVPSDAQCAILLKAAPEWKLVYEDHLNTIFFRRAGPRAPARRAAASTGTAPAA